MSVLELFEKKGFRKGFQEGMKKGFRKAIENLLKEGMEEKFIARTMKVTLTYVRELKEELKRKGEL